MLSVKSFNGLDLAANPPVEAVYLAANASSAVQVTIQARIIEDDPLLIGMRVNGTLDWNDGSLPTVYVATSGTLAINSARALTNGEYMISVCGSNYRSPAADQVRVNFPVHVSPQSNVAPPANLIFGPILPRDSGFPNADQWNFDTESDLLILESSVRMLLLTSKGERLMEPDYGTNLRSLLFEQNVNNLDNTVREEIVQAMNTWEPRLQLQSISVQKTDARSVTVNASFLSKLNSQGFDINLQFVR